MEVGSDIPALPKVATTQTLVKWAGACGDFNPLHYDEKFATAQGWAGPVVHGPLKRAWLIQMLVDWIGDEGRVTKLACQFSAADYPRHMEGMSQPGAGETWKCRGRVTGKCSDRDGHFVECDIWIENGKGLVTTQGHATVTLPLKSTAI